MAIDLIKERLRRQHGGEVEDTYETSGIPEDMASAQALFARSPFEFERWAVSLIDGTPNERQVGDRGIDGLVRFGLGGDTAGRMLVSVKGGRRVGPSAVRDLVGAVQSANAEMGVLITLHPSTPAMKEAAASAGTFFHPLYGRSYPRAQIITVPELLNHRRPEMPTPYSPYTKAQKTAMDQLSLGLWPADAASLAAEEEEFYDTDWVSDEDP